MKNRLILFITLSLIAFLLSGCGGIISRRPTEPRYTPFTESGPPRYSGESYKINGKHYPIMASAAGYEEYGEASWYGPGFHRKKTANGERYNMHALTAAHPNLPMDTVVEVTNKENGRKVKVRINDRGPFVNDRIIDLSKKAAQIIELNGKAKVKVKALGRARH